MIVILVRHGEAERETSKDSDRQLTELGQRQAEETARFILSKYEPDTFVVSPYVRAQQTLSAFTQSRPDIPIIVKEGITPSDDPMKALQDLMDIESQCMVVVCHMPIVARLAALLTGDDSESYSLAEARIIEAPFIATDMGKEIERFVPNQY